MKCFQHGTVDAVGVYKNCQRGLCPDCVALVGVNVACKGRCEAVVERVAAMVDRASSPQGMTRVNAKTFHALAAWMFVGAIAFLVVVWETSVGTPPLVAYAGPLFFALGGFVCRGIAKKWDGLA